MEKIKLILIEDEHRLADIIGKQLRETGFDIDIAYDGYSGKQLVMNNNYHLVLLDINLPLINGYELCKEIRSVNKNIPIIMITALGTSDHKMHGFDAGADDYIIKPIDFRELTARINVFLRRSEIKIESEKLKVDDLEMDINTKTVSRAGKRIELTAKESSLLETFMRNKGILLSREYIIEHVWDIDFDPGTNIIDVYVNYLRKKVDKGFEKKLIHTKFGFGFYCSEDEI